MSEVKTFTIVFTRIELTWLYRQLCAGKDKAEGIIKTHGGGDVISQAKATEAQVKEHAEARVHFEELTRLTQIMKERLDAGEKERLQLVNIRMDLMEATELVEEKSAKEAITNRLAELPAEEPYRIQFDKGTCKFTLRLIESDLHKFRSQVIPQYEASKPEDYTDDIQTKSYWVNKARKSKAILDGLKTKLEKAL